MKRFFKVPATLASFHQTKVENTAICNVTLHWKQ